VRKSVFEGVILGGRVFFKSTGNQTYTKFSTGENLHYTQIAQIKERKGRKYGGTGKTNFRPNSFFVENISRKNFFALKSKLANKIIPVVFNQNYRYN